LKAPSQQRVRFFARNENFGERRRSAMAVAVGEFRGIGKAGSGAREFCQQQRR